MTNCCYRLQRKQIIIFNEHTTIAIPHRIAARIAEKRRKK